MLKIFIDRPVLSTVISIIIVVLGIIGIYSLPVEQFPDIAPPTVQVQTTYPGASADVVMNSVIIPLEEQINGVEGMAYMTSTAENNGAATIHVYFRQGTDPDIAAVNVQNLAARANPLLPQEVMQTGVTIQKQQNSIILGVSLTTDNPDYDEEFLQNYANINLLPQIKRVYGVGDASVRGAKDYSMRIWLKPDVLASYRLSVQEVLDALQDQNIEAAPGELGENSGRAFQYTLKYTGRLKTAEQFGDIIIRTQDHRMLYMKDVANVELGSASYTTTAKMNGMFDQAYIVVSQTAGSNAQQIIEDIKTLLKDAEKSMPQGITISYVIDSSEFLYASIRKVIETLIEAFILVFIVVFVFLQDLRSTIIPAIAVPVAIVGTFFFLQVLGFSINLLTLFALVLAIGIVVDDAIVVVEAVHARLDAGERDVRKATLEAIKEIAPAIISITLVMSAVFIPVSFVGGTSGIFFRQFGLTLAIAIVLSAVNALTLSPALSALFLKSQKESNPENDNHKIKRFYRRFNSGFNAVVDKYRLSLHFLGKKKNRWITAGIIVAAGLTLFGLMRKLPTGFVPQEDSGVIWGFVTLPPGASLERSDSVTMNVVDMVQGIEGVQKVINITGMSMTGLGSSYGTLVIRMEPWGDRKVTTDQVVNILTQRTKEITDATCLFMSAPTLQGFGLGFAVEIQMQDRMNAGIDKFYEVTSEMISRLNQQDEIMVARTNFNPNFPQKMIEADVPKIKASGMTLSQVMGTLQACIGSYYVSNFNLYGKQYRVLVQAAPEYRSEIEDLNKIFVQTAGGQMAPITEFIIITDVTEPQMLTRFNMYSSMDLIIIPNTAKGYGTGDIIKIAEELRNELPAGYSFEYSGLTREEVGSSNQTILIFGICLIFVYLLLAALYESYILPLAIILSLPIGLAGVFIFLSIFGVSQGIVNNIYVQISLIMLIGLLAKNAILIVEYAIQRRRQGMSIVDSAINGAVARFRPILMTSFAFIFGLLPLALSTGAGAIGNRSIGISSIGGMLIGTLIGVLVIPSLFIIFQSIQERFSKSGMLNSDDEL